MRQIELSPREARMLRDTLAANQEGYDYPDLKKLDWLCQKLTALMGEYGAKMVEFGREERRIRKSLSRGQITQAAADEALAGVRYDVEDLNEEADKADPMPWFLEEADYKLVKDKLSGVKWIGLEDMRSLIIGMMEAIEEAKQVEPAAVAAPLESEAKAEPEPNAHKRKVSLVGA